ncbi:hypothetical protein [Chengkuizengella axinellae]|uniref:DUF3221 domain-containing protein n=1 Tax=Chengkuizengella axinellae TaxID=3064388 RepID=A0ABT9IU48_9BACL|nr:hypothetical protein [Chengkuizengella sp. 2205SS18-9]MDP5272869.1 hypothetical protein [Chengkuizengella sp. 2205SS18-9]
MKKLTILVFSMLAIIIGILVYNPLDTEVGDYIIDKNDDRQQILVANDIAIKDIESVSILDESFDLIYYDIEDEELYKNLQVGEKVTVVIKTDEDGHYVVKYSAPPQAAASEIIRH